MAMTLTKEYLLRQLKGVVSGKRNRRFFIQYLMIFVRAHCYMETLGAKACFLSRRVEIPNLARLICRSKLKLYLS